MNILAINWRCIKNPEMGGAEIHFHEIFKRIAAKGHKVTLVAHHFDNSPQREIVDGIEILRIGNKFLFNKQFKHFYQKNLVKNNYDLIVDDISKIPLNTSKYISKPIVGILHHIHGNSLYKEIPFPLAYYIIQKEKQIPQNYNSTPIFTVSESTQNELVELGFKKELTSILHNSINHKLFEKIEIKKSKTPTLVYVGRIKKYKNIKFIIDALPNLISEFPEIKLFIGGKGDDEENLKNYVSEKKLEKFVTFLGFLTEEEKAELLGNSWIFVTMAEKEGWGITVIEANAMKTPAIGSNVHGLRDSIKNNETGFLVKLGDTKKLSEKISEILRNKNELNRISENAYNWSKKFNWDKSAEHFLQKTAEWYPQLKSKI
ncbi:MAG: glycosyltransferase family 4 protein [Ignavibacteriae bacterium]|nr:glycosyltransferase family 4 protein [Ignavibacteriota bacterium]